MDWSQHSIPPMRLEPRFGDRMVPAFCERPKSIAAMVADKGFDTLDSPIKLVTAPHTPVPFSPPLEQFYVPSPERIADTVREIV